MIDVPAGAAAIQLGGHVRGSAIRGYALVDASDYDWLTQWKWSLVTGYPSRINGRTKETIRMHRQILGLEPGDGLHTDHINRCRTDNRRSNLRVVTHAQNMQNLPPRRGTTSRFRGVSLENGRWRAYASHSGKQRTFGYFDDEEEAAAAAARGRAELMPFAVD